MIVYRLSKKKYSADLSGRGAEKAGGRWNSKGLPIVYTSESRALCTTEIAVHSPLGNIPTDYYLTTIEIPPTASILEIKQAELLKDWKAIPHSNSTQLIGDRFLFENKFLVLKVPSVVVQGDFNYLLNPAHRLFQKVKITNTALFEFGERLFKK
ncbi:MAG: RES family NAD+ phosphorylase [Bacteroidota bacterium]|nr:RES family NAD+ phosphorylase [Bacteroidota bacterium]